MTAPLVDVDERTRDELAPPCDKPECGNPAKWVLRFVTLCDHGGTYLTCTGCGLPYVEARGCWCPADRIALALVSVEAL